MDATGTDGGNADTYQAPVFSSDGTKIAFATLASNLGPTDTNGRNDIYVRDLVAATTTLVSANVAGTDSGNHEASRVEPPVFAADGSRVVFASRASDLGAVDTNDQIDVYLRDLASATTSLVSATPAGAAGDKQSSDIAVNPDGSGVAFTSFATDLDFVDGNGDDSPDVFLRDLATNTTSVVSRNAAGTASGNGDSTNGRFSPDGTRIAFGSHATDLGGRDTNSQRDLYLRDLTTGTTALVTTNAAGTDSSNGPTVALAFSPEGDGIAFQSLATDLGPRDTNSHVDIYFRDLAAARTTLVSSNIDGTDGGNGPSNTAFVVRAGKVAFSSLASNLAEGGSDRTDVFVAAIRDADVSVTLTAGPDPVPAGGTVSYDVVFTNDGPDPAPRTTGVLVLPEQTGAVTISGGGGVCSIPPQNPPRTVVCRPGTLAPGQELSMTVTAVVTAPSGSTLNALAGIVSSFPDSDESDNLALAAVDVG